MATLWNRIVIFSLTKLLLHTYLNLRINIYCQFLLNFIELHNSNSNSRIAIAIFLRNYIIISLLIIRMSEEVQALVVDNGECEIYILLNMYICVVLRIFFCVLRILNVYNIYKIYMVIKLL